MTDPILRFGITGLAQSGKTCLFNALTGMRLPTGPGAAARPHPGMVKVPDHRLEELARLSHFKKVVPAEVEYLDFPGSLKDYTRSGSRVQGPGHGEGSTLDPRPSTLSREKGSGAGYLPDLAQMDALVYVIRAFPHGNVPHELGSVDPWRDLETLEFELSFADMVLVDRRLERIRESAGKFKPQEREAMEKERDLLSRLKEGLEKGLPLRAQEIADQEEKALRNYQFLTSKPALAVVNIGEEDLPRAADMETEARRRLGPGAATVAASCQIEMEMLELEPEEADEFRASLGIQGHPVQRIIQLCHDVSQRIHFFTIAHEELRAWPLPQGSTALQAAGLIHTDMERGFIRAEAIPWQDLVRTGSLAEARRHGLVRAEGKTYRVQDGDVITFLFHV